MDGVAVVQEQHGSDLVIEAAQSLDAPDLSGLLEQLEEEGFASPVKGGVLIPWEQVYALQAHPAFADSLALLHLPPATTAGPVLKSHHSLSDPHFAITVSGWHDGSGRTLAVQGVYGAVIRTADGESLLSHAAWITLRHISAFQRRSETDRTDLFHRRQWGVIRQAALAANARLDDFLYRCVVITPEKLDIGLRHTEVCGTRLVEVSPSFPGAPAHWLEVFDACREVPNRYDISTQDGILQVLMTPEVKTVLSQIKRFDRRRVAGSRAEAFVTNPFAALGEDAAHVIDPDQFERERERVGLVFDRFFALIQPDAAGYPEQVGLRIEAATHPGSASTETRWFRDDAELEAFIGAIDRALNQQRQICAWSGFEFELLGDTPGEIERLRAALEERRTPRILVSYAQVYDLSRYSARVVDIGVEKPTYYSLDIAKKNDDEGWFPDNILPLISFQPEGSSEPVVIPLTPPVREQLAAKLTEAKAAGQTTFQIKGFPQPIPVREAEAILQTFTEALSDARQGTFNPDTAKRSPVLIIEDNIPKLNYEEKRRDILKACPTIPVLPKALRDDIRLLNHQCEGVARLQHLFQKSPQHCRGVVLADDRGLGKTLQLLALIAWAFEQNPALEPALIVAPVSLLENWEEETQKFFKPHSLPLLTLYGSSIQSLRVPRASIDAQLVDQDGLVKFLRPDWRQGARLVLTTYETLRDFEFSFAAEGWSIMVCDEAQKIKNPNTLVTRSAKKQKVRFKIACTGTPVENTLVDLWCLFDFIQPGLLGALNDFGRRYRRPIEAKTDEEKARVEELRTRIAPQIIRRTKAQVAKDLPRKLEQDCRIPLSSHQRALYANAIDLFKKRNTPNVVVPFKNHLGLLQYLRLICTDPRRHGMDVFKPELLGEYRHKAPKLHWLLETLSLIQHRAEKVIVFCEFRAIQRLLKHYIEQAFGFSPDIINGDSKASTTAADSRQKRIKAFQAKAGFGAIILSPVAVGFGVNIQAANHVIHYTRHWNPAKEDQATDRAYRIGATKDVHVYYPQDFRLSWLISSNAGIS